MGFGEPLKLKVKKKAHFHCCLCKAVGVEIHHILPQEEGGPDTIDNAPPLCPSCHEIYGANPKKRKFIREARDFWYEICAKRFQSDPEILSEMRQGILDGVSKKDMATFKDEILTRLEAQQKHLSPKDTEKEKLTISQVLGVILSKKHHLSYSALNILFSDRIWDEGEYPEYKEHFFRRFGELAAEQVCYDAMEDTGYDLSKPFTAEELSEVVHSVRVMVILMNLHDKGKTQVSLNTDRELLWDVKNKDGTNN